MPFPWFSPVGLQIHVSPSSMTATKSQIVTANLTFDFDYYEFDYQYDNVAFDSQC